MPNYSKIDDGVYQGGVTETFPDDVCAVLNLVRATDTRFPDDKICAYLWLPIQDEPLFPGLAWLKLAVAFVASARAAGWGILIHCRAGVSRSGMVNVAYHMYINRWTRDQALSYIRQKRPQTCPNPAFMDGLLEYQKELGIG